uniref:Putative secreted protein n=1 Tax=Ixodes ricinus TaxID=34613 RepID=A0A6B0UJ05_IXORI
MASRLLAQRRTTLRLVWWIFSVSWSTAMLLGAHTSTGPLLCFTRWYTIVPEVTVLPVPGGPCIRERGLCRACLTAYTWERFSSGRLGAEKCLGSWQRITTSSTSWPSSL